MLNLFRRHLASCPLYGKRTGSKCQRKPPCPIHYEGIDGSGKRHRPKALLDPRTGRGTRDWALACEIVRDLESPASAPAQQPATSIEAAIQHYLALKLNKTSDTYRRNKRVLAGFKAFMESSPRNHLLMSEVKFPDLTDFCSQWKGSNATKNQALGKLGGFLDYCYRASFTSKNIGEGLSRTLGWQNDTAPKEPFSPGELERLWDALPSYADKYGKCGQRIAQQTEAFVYVMRYTGLDVSTTLTLAKASVRGNKILTHRLKTGAEVWTVIPEWVADKLMSAPHDSARYFFWTGASKPHTRANTWFERLRKLLDLAGLPHRTPHNFRHHFAIEHLLQGTPIEDVARLLGHGDINVTLRSYAAWIKLRQERLEQQQRKIWESDPLHKRMATKENK